MGLQIVKSEGVDSQEVFQKILEVPTGGFALVNSELVQTGIDAGCPLYINEATRLAYVVKTATLQADAANDATTYKLNKGHNFKVGDYVAFAVGGTAYAITAIDTTTSADYDEITVGTTLGVGYTAADGDVMFESGATGATAAAYKYTTNALLKNYTKVGVNESCSAVVRGTVYSNRLPYAISTAMKTALTDRIIFSLSY